MSPTWAPPSNHESRPVVVLGAGVLGRRIAACWSAGGYNVRIRNPGKGPREAALQYIKDNITSFTALSHREAGPVTTDYEDIQSAVKDAWLVIEAVPEKLEIKESTFADLEKYAPADCVLATNSSSFKSGDLIGKIGIETRTRVLNTHYMMPPDAMVVELMTDGYTSEPLLSWLADRHREAGLHPIVAMRPSSGFVFNRLFAAIKREVLMELAEGVTTPEQIDAVWREMYGPKVAPCTMMDGVGLDTVALIEEHYVTERGLPRFHVDWLKEKYVSPGRLGAKTPGKGGLYPPPKTGSQLHIITQDNGLVLPIGGTAPADVLKRGSIIKITPGVGKPVTLVSPQHLPDGIDICNANNRMYWTNMGATPGANDGSIMSANLDGSDLTTIVPEGSCHTPKQMIVEQTSQKLYFSDREGLTVWRCNIDGSALESIVKTGDWKDPEQVKDQTKWCVGICVAPSLGKFFWTQKGFSKSQTGRIFSANIETPRGATDADRQDIQLVLGHLPEPIDLEFDESSGALYWTDRGELPLGQSLNRKQLTGGPASAEKGLGYEVVAQGIGEAIGLKLDQENRCMYTSDLNGRLWRIELDGHGTKEVIFEDHSRGLTGVTFFKT